MKSKSKPMPSLPNDRDAEAFVAHADLSKYDLSGFKPMRFEIEPKAAVLNVRQPAGLLEAVKTKAAARGVPYTRYVRMLLETMWPGRGKNRRRERVSVDHARPSLFSPRLA